MVQQPSPTVYVDPQHARVPAAQPPVRKTPDVDGATEYVRKRYTGAVRKVDEKTISVIWESGAEGEFENVKATAKREFGVTVLLSAIE
ncbi:MAG: hypothetical protein C0404_13775 [Verrucomicrobia bacterium]|nr:hypothetical protein [Verrucomicrobiota bacterium]